MVVHFLIFFIICWLWPHRYYSRYRYRDYSLLLMELSLVYQWYVSTGNISFNHSTILYLASCQNRTPNADTHLKLFRTAYLAICSVHLVTNLFPFLGLLCVIQSLLLCSSDKKIFLTSCCDVTDHFTHTHTHKRTRTHIRAQTRARTHTHTHTLIRSVCV